MNIREAIEKLVNRANLSEEETISVMNEIMTGEATPLQVASFLTALRMKGETVEEARIFLDNFRISAFRPEVLMIYAEAAEDAASRLSHDASRRLNEEEMNAGGAPLRSYFLNFNGLDRYNRQGITFTFDARETRYLYDGESWQEIVHRYPRSPEAAEARAR